jgi:2,4-didehydro-3-deoxy-L-rhamnonate hydrolase
MRVELANRLGRACLLAGDRALDLETRSGGRFSADPMAALARFDELRDWAAGQLSDERDAVLDRADLGPCVPRPSQVFAIGLNYRDHASEAGLQVPKQPMVFTKFASCLSGARSDIELTSDTVDYEIELCVVIGKRAAGVSEARALEHVAGYCVGQDVSDRRLQFADVPPQFSLSKSAPGFGPIGPAVVARSAALDAPLPLLCDVNGVRKQNGTTSDMIFSVPEVIAYLSRHTTLMVGDVIFTGTPSGVGSVQKPRLYLQPGDIVRSEIPGLGFLENHCVKRSETA